MIILGIDTSCDETSVGITSDLRVLSNVVSSQVRFHQKFGGVVPFLAQRLHKERIDQVVELALRRTNLTWKRIDAIAVTQGPGLAPALEVGIQKAKELALAYKKPLYAVNHMAGHLTSCFLQVGSRSVSPPLYPILALLVSGGHTELVINSKPGHYQIIGQTLDDALGEAYDKVAKMLGLGYPGGKLIAKLAEEGNPKAFSLPIPLQHRKDLNFSYSGLKNAVRLLVYDLKNGHHDIILRQSEIQDVAAVFQDVALDSALLKVKRALEEYPEVKFLLLAGGVAANTVLRKKIRKVCKEKNVSLKVPSNLKLCTDNAAMIAGAAFLGIQARQQPEKPQIIDRKPGWTIEEASLS